jgi:hypothetical protein
MAFRTLRRILGRRPAGRKRSRGGAGRWGAQRWRASNGHRAAGGRQTGVGGGGGGAHTWVHRHQQALQLPRPSCVLLVPLQVVDLKGGRGGGSGEHAGSTGRQGGAAPALRPSSVCRQAQARALRPHAACPPATLGPAAGPGAHCTAAGPGAHCTAAGPGAHCTTPSQPASQPASPPWRGGLTHAMPSPARRRRGASSAPAAWPRASTASRTSLGGSPSAVSASCRRTWSREGGGGGGQTCVCVCVCVCVQASQVCMPGVNQGRAGGALLHPPPSSPRSQSTCVGMRAAAPAAQPACAACPRPLCGPSRPVASPPPAAPHLPAQRVQQVVQGEIAGVVQQAVEQKEGCARRNVALQALHCGQKSGGRVEGGSLLGEGELKAPREAGSKGCAVRRLPPPPPHGPCLAAHLPRAGSCRTSSVTAGGPGGGSPAPPPAARPAGRRRSWRWPQR